MTNLTAEAERLEQRVLNAPTIEAARRYHIELDKLRARMPPPPRSRHESSDYRRGYQAGWMAGRAEARR